VLNLKQVTIPAINSKKRKTFSFDFRLNSVIPPAASGSMQGGFILEDPKNRLTLPFESTLNRNLSSFEEIEDFTRSSTIAVRPHLIKSGLIFYPIWDRSDANLVSLDKYPIQLVEEGSAEHFSAQKDWAFRKPIRFWSEFLNYEHFYDEKAFPGLGFQVFRKF
jgi:hypothetical protein